MTSLEVVVLSVRQVDVDWFLLPFASTLDDRALRAAGTKHMDFGPVRMLLCSSSLLLFFSEPNKKET